MATLHTLFYSRRASLQRDLDDARTAREVVARLHRALDDIQTAFTADLPPPQARLAIAFLEIIRLATASLGTATATNRGRRFAAGRRPWAAWLLAALQIGVGAGAMVSLVRTLPDSWLSLLLVALLLGLGLLKYLLATA